MTRIALLAAAVLALAAAGCGGDKSTAPTTTGEPPTAVPQETKPVRTEPPSPPPAPATTAPAKPKPKVAEISIIVRGGKVSGGIRRATVKRNSQAVLVVRADAADHVHLHGYDKFADVTPSKPARLAFKATIRGRFEVELEERGLQIADITVK